MKNSKVELLEDIMPHDLINSKMITSTITEFLWWSIITIYGSNKSTI